MVRVNVIGGHIFGSLFCALLCVPAVAQQKHGKDTTAKPSFTNKSEPAHTPKSTAPASEEETADAIVGDALNLMYVQADHHYHKGEWNHCINIYRIVEQGDPHNMETYSNSAYLLWSSDRNDEALAQLKQGLQANPTGSYMYDELGQHYWLHMHDAVSAIPYFEKAIQYPVGWTTYHNLAHCYEKLGKWDKAVGAWKEATKYGDDVVAGIRLKRAEAHLTAHD